MNKRGMSKRGQLTIFIIIAIVIIASIIFFFSFKDKLEIFRPVVNEADKIHLFVEECIENIGEDAIYFISKNGGYFLTSELSTSDGIPYYYFEGKSYVPSKEDIEKEVSYYINEMLSSCTNEFTDFPDLNISEGEVNTTIEIKDEEIIFDVNYPVRIRKGESTTLFEDFKDIRISVRVGAMYDSIEEIQGHLEQEEICLSCISDIALENDLIIDMTNVEEGIIFTIKDETSEIKGAPLEWRFANKYKLE